MAESNTETRGWVAEGSTFSGSPITKGAQPRVGQPASQGKPPASGSGTAQSSSR